MDDEILVQWAGRMVAEPLPVKSYPDGMPLVRLPSNVGRPTRLLVRPHSVNTLMAALWFVDAVKARGYPAPELILPNVPGARQDRVNPDGDYLFTLKSVAHEINARDFPKVTILDPHSDVAPALIERSEVLRVDQILAFVARTTGDFPFGLYDMVVSPDAGAEKRAGFVAKQLGKPLVRAWKTRDVKTGDITGFGMEAGAFAACRALVVDDICDAGGTFVGLGVVLADHGYTADLWTTHGYYSRGTERLLTAGYKRLYTTDSVLRVPPSGTEWPGVVPIDICTALLSKGYL